MTPDRRRGLRVAGSRPNVVVARLVARRAARSGVLWGAVFGVYVISSAASYAGAYPTQSSRRQLAQSLGANAGIRALLGPARHIDTVAGFTAWRALGVLALVGAAWGLLAGTRLLRGEEEAGRWELLLSGQTTRGGATVQALAGLAVGWVALWATTAILAVAAARAVNPPLSTRAAVFLSLALASSAAMFLVIGALTSQLAVTRRRAAALAGGVFGVAFVVRVVADSGSSLQWARWLSPLGWVEELHPLTGSRPTVLLPIAGLVGSLAAVTVRLAAARDVDASVWADRDTAPSRTRLLGSAAGLSVRLSRPVAVAWIAAIGTGGLFFGLIAQSAANAVSGSATVQQAIGRLGGHHGGARAYLGLTFVIVATLVALVAAGHVVAAREEEADGRLDNLVARPLSRSSWLAGRVATAATVVVLCGVAAGILAWVGAASQHSGLSVTSLLAAGINVVPAALFLLGLGTLVHGVAPRLAGPVAYGLVAWSFLIELIGSVLKANHWLLDTSILYHVAPAPATNPNWGSATALVLLGAALAGLGSVAFARRDLISA